MNINYQNQGYEDGYNDFEQNATIIFEPYSFTGRATYGSSTSATGTNSDGTNTFSCDMRADLGVGYTNYTTDHFSNFSVSAKYVSGYNGYSNGLHNYSYKYHTYDPSTGILKVYIYGHTGDYGNISIQDMTSSFTIIKLKQ